MKVTETYPKGCEHCGALGYTNYYLTDGKTGSQYTNTCPVCKGAKTVTVTREYEVPDVTIPQIPFVQEVDKNCENCRHRDVWYNDEPCKACVESDTLLNWQPK